MNVKEAFERIIDLTEDHSWSHAARMVSIKKIAIEALEKVKPVPPATVVKRPGRPKASDGGETGDEIQEQDPSDLGKVTI